MDMISILTKKRNSDCIDQQEYDYFVSGLLSGEISDGEASALLMAIALNGLSEDEIFCFASAIAKHGTTIDLSFEKGVVVDLLSIGEISDSLSLIEMSVLSSIGFKIAKIAHEGMQFSKSTLDRLQVINGFSGAKNAEDFFDKLKTCRVGLLKRPNGVCPVDAKLLMLREKIGLVPSVPLMLVSIFAKKIAMKAKVLSANVFCGEGSMISSVEEAESIAKLIVSISKRIGIKPIVFVASLSEPLNAGVGEAVEISSAVSVLSCEPGTFESYLVKIAREICSNICITSNVVKGKNAGYDLFNNAIYSGKALKQFEDIISEYDGEKLSLIKKNIDSIQKTFVKAPKDGYVSDIDCNLLSLAVNELEKGAEKLFFRKKYYGIRVMIEEGTYVKEGDPIALIVSSLENEKYATSIKLVKNAIVLSALKKQKANLQYQILC